MSDSTDVLIAPTRSDLAPTDPLPPPGSYQTRPERCVVELSCGVLRLLWARLRPPDGELVIGADARSSSLLLEFHTKPSRVGIPFSRGRFDLGRVRTMTFRSHELRPVAPKKLLIRGELDRLGIVEELDLTTRVVHVDAESVVLHARGSLLPPPWESHDMTLLSGRLSIEIAMEFSR